MRSMLGMALKVAGSVYLEVGVGPSCQKSGKGGSQSGHTERSSDREDRAWSYGILSSILSQIVDLAL